MLCLESIQQCADQKQRLSILDCHLSSTLTNFQYGVISRSSQLKCYSVAIINELPGFSEIKSSSLGTVNKASSVALVVVPLEQSSGRQTSRLVAWVVLGTITRSSDVKSVI